MAELESGSKWWLRYVFVPILASAAMAAAIATLPRLLVSSERHPFQLYAGQPPLQILYSNQGHTVLVLNDGPGNLKLIGDDNAKVVVIPPNQPTIYRSSNIQLQAVDQTVTGKFQVLEPANDKTPKLESK